MEKLYPERLSDLPFDQYQRYSKLHTVVEKLRIHLGRSLKILDVGGYLQGGNQEEFCPIQRFLPDDHIVIMDVKHKGPGNYVAGSGFDSPFRSRTFDVVCAMDTLEHIPAYLRPAFIENCCSISNACVFFAGPVWTEETELAELILDQFIYQLFKIRHPALTEHIQFGLPHINEIEKELQRSGFRGMHYADGYLPRWLFMMIIKHYLMKLPDPIEIGRLFDRFYNMTVGMDDTREPAYREVFVFFRDDCDINVQDFKNDETTPLSESMIEKNGYALSNLLLMLQTARLGSIVSEKLDTPQDLPNLIKLCEERYQMIVQKDDAISRQIRSLQEKDQIIADKENVITTLINELDNCKNNTMHKEQEAASIFQAMRDELDNKCQLINELTKFKEEIIHRKAYGLLKKLNLI